MTKHLNKTKIEWCDYTWNPVTGCLHGCEYCYARKSAENPFYAKAFPFGFEPHFYEERIMAPFYHKKPSRIFAVSMGDLFGEWVDGDWIFETFAVMAESDWHQFFLLTKNPRGIRKLYDESTNWYLGGGDYLPNVFLGVSVTCQEDVWRIDELRKQWVGPKFISFEPLLEPIEEVDLTDIDWVIIGAQTQPKKPVDEFSIGYIISEADKRKIPVFMKNNLNIEEYGYTKRQEFPK